MIWVAIAIIVVGAFAFPRLGVALLGILGVVLVLGVLAGVAYWVWDKRESERRAKERAVAEQRIPVASVWVEDPRLWTGSSKLTARVHNLSTRDTLAELALRITVEDCTTRNALTLCDVVGQTETRIYQKIPPGQARDIDEHIYFSPPLNIRGIVRWDLAKTGTAASSH